MPRLNANACGMYGNMPADEKNVALLSRKITCGPSSRGAGLGPRGLAVGGQLFNPIRKQV